MPGGPRRMKPTRHNYLCANLPALFVVLLCCPGCLLSASLAEARDSQQQGVAAVRGAAHHTTTLR